VAASTPSDVIAAPTVAAIVSSNGRARSAKSQPAPLVPPTNSTGLTKGGRDRSGSSTQDWPTLQEAIVVSVVPSMPKKMDSVSITSSTGSNGKGSHFRTKTSETATDSGSEDHGATGNSAVPELMRGKEKWPSINGDDGKSGGTHSSDAISDDGPSESSNEAGGDKDKDDDCSSSANEHELEAEQRNTGRKKTKKKWVPLEIDVGMSKGRRYRRRSNERERRGRPVSSHAGKSDCFAWYILKHGVEIFHDWLIFIDPNGSGDAGRRGGSMTRGRTGPTRGRGGPRNGRGTHWNHHNGRDGDGSIASPIPRGDEYNDYPAEYTSLTSLYPSEFIMPYVTNGFYPAPFTPPATGGVVEDPTAAGLIPPPTAYPPGVDGVILVDLVRKQM